LVGLGEVGLILSSSAPPEEYWLVPYAVVAYGTLGGGIAAVAAILGLLIRRSDSSSSGFALGVGTALAALLIVVGRYHVIQRVFHEELVLLSGMGLGVHAGLAMSGVFLGWLCARVLRHAYRALAIGGMIVALALVLGGSVALAVATGRPDGKGTVGAAHASARGPNVILIVADTLRADVLGGYGGRPQQSPAIDALARDGVLFERAYAQSSWTRPSIASLLTSEYPSGHGAIHKMDMLPDRALTIAEVFQAAGYWTAGVVTNINVAPIFNFQQGFGEYHYLEPAFYFWASDSATRLAIYKGLRIARERLGANRMYFYNYYQDAEVVGETVAKWLEAQRAHPFFLLIHYMDPHDPFFAIPYDGHAVARASTPNPPHGRQREMFEMYLQDVTYLDRHLGELLQRLRTLDLYDDTVIALVADHGEEFLEHGGWWHGTTLYEEQVHVPLIVKRAHESAGGTRRRDLVRTIDVAPTLAAAAGLSLPREFKGRDLFGAETAPEPLFAEEDLEGNVLTSLRIGDWKVITANPGNPRGLAAVELYDLSADPRELVNRAGSDPERVRALLEELARVRARITAGGRHAQVETHAPDRRS
jgi:arylsulfatase A-like enzyme